LYGVDAARTTMCQDGKQRKIPDLFKHGVKTVISRGRIWGIEMRAPQYSVDLLGRSGRLPHQILFFRQQSCIKASFTGVCMCEFEDACEQLHPLAISKYIGAFIHLQISSFSLCSEAARPKNGGFIIGYYRLPYDNPRLK